MGVTSFQQSLYEFFDSGLLFRIALLVLKHQMLTVA